MTVESICTDFLRLLNSVHFFEKYQGVDSYQFSKAFDYKTLFDERDLESIIRFLPETNSDESRFNLVFHGVAIDLDSIRVNGSVDYNQLIRLHNGGATLIVNGVDNYSNPLYYWSKYLEKVFQCRVQVNFYGTPTNSRGFNPHIDDHDVIVSQLKGSKEWSFYDLKEGKPSAIRKAYTQEEVSHKRKSMLEMGDLLYVPRGLLHSAKATNTTSWHLTTGLNAYYWSDLLKSIVDYAALEIDELQQFVKMHSVNEKELHSQALDLIDRLKSHISPTEGIKGYESKFPNIGKFLDQIVVPKTEQLANLSGHMLFRIAANPTPEIKFKKTSILLDLPYRRKPLMIHHRLSKAISFMQSNAEFSANGLPDLADIHESHLLTYYLWNNGIIEPVP
jgi:hypothetical protein